jgi:hypothetical protein
MKRYVHFLSYLTQLFLEWEMFQTNILEKIKIHILFSITIFENFANYDIMWKNIVEQERTQMTIWPLRVACWITKSTNTHSLNVVLIDFLLQQWLHYVPQCYVIHMLPVLTFLEWMIYTDIIVKCICLLRTENIVLCTMGNVERKQNATCNLRSWWGRRGGWVGSGIYLIHQWSVVGKDDNFTCLGSLVTGYNNVSEEITKSL